MDVVIGVCESRAMNVSPSSPPSAPLLRLQRQPRPPVAPEQHAHVHPPKCVRLDHHPARPPSASAHVPALPRIAPPHEDRGSIRRRARVPKKTTSSPCCRSARVATRASTGPPRPVQHLHPDASPGRRDGVGVAGDALAPGGSISATTARDRHRERGDQARAGGRDEAVPETHRGFGKRPARSSTRCASRSAATVAQHAGRILGKPCGQRGAPLALERRAPARGSPRSRAPARPCPTPRSRPSDIAPRRARPDRSHPRPRRARRWPAHAAARPAPACPAPSGRAWPARRRATRRAATPPGASARARPGHAHAFGPARRQAPPPARCGPPARATPPPTPAARSRPRRHASSPSPRTMLSISRVRPTRAASATTVSASDRLDRRQRARLRDRDILDRHRGLGRERVRARSPRAARPRSARRARNASCAARSAALSTTARRRCSASR